MKCFLVLSVFSTRHIFGGVLEIAPSQDESLHYARVLSVFSHSHAVNGTVLMTTCLSVCLHLLSGTYLSLLQQVCTNPSVHLEFQPDAIAGNSLSGPGAK